MKAYSDLEASGWSIPIPDRAISYVRGKDSELIRMRGEYLRYLVSIPKKSSVSSGLSSIFSKQVNSVEVLLHINSNIVFRI